MNERIQALIERAEYQAKKHSGSDWEVYVEPSREQIFEKFAELIVKKCLSMIENEAAQYAEPVWAVELLNDIKDHFGVEE